MHLFDGKKVASEIEERLKQKVSGTSKVLHSIVVGDEGGAMKYQEMKKAAAERVGAKLIIDQFNSGVSPDELISKIQDLGSDNSVDGIMVQLPLPESLKPHTQEIINAITGEKDVDSMREDSPYTAPVVKAVMLALSQAYKTGSCKDKRTLVVGSEGFVGQKIIQHLADKQYAVVGMDEGDYLDPYTQSADIVISATGVPGIITPDNIKEGVILIDVGAPEGDVARDAYEKASFISPVPGGLGPVTIACLMENLINSSS